MTAPPLRMLWCHARHQLIEMEERGLVRALLLPSYLSASGSRSGLALLLLLLSSSLQPFNCPCLLRAKGSGDSGQEGRNSSHRLTTSSSAVWLVVSGMRWVTSCSPLKQVTHSLLLASGCTERVGAVWHKQGIQLAEPETDGAGKWGTSPKHRIPPSIDPPHTSLCFTPLSSTNEPFWAATTLKVSADGHTSSTPGKRQINLLNMELTVTVNGVVLGVISRDEFSFTWRSQQMAGSNLGSLWGATADDQGGSRISSSSHYLCSSNPPLIKSASSERTVCEYLRNLARKWKRSRKNLATPLKTGVWPAS